MRKIFVTEVDPGTYSPFGRLIRESELVMRYNTFVNPYTQDMPKIPFRKL